MNAPEVALIKRCPMCRSERPANELICRHEVDGVVCHWDLTNEPLVPVTVPPGDTAAAPDDTTVKGALRTCQNGHPMEAGDELCVVCGADVAQPPSDASTEPEPLPPGEDGDREEAPLETETVIDGWRLVRRLEPPTTNAPFQTFLVAAEGVDREGYLGAL